MANVHVADPPERNARVLTTFLVTAGQQGSARSATCACRRRPPRTARPAAPPALISVSMRMKRKARAIPITIDCSRRHDRAGQCWSSAGVMPQRVRAGLVEVVQGSGAKAAGCPGSPTSELRRDHVDDRAHAAERSRDADRGQQVPPVQPPAAAKLRCSSTCTRGARAPRRRARARARATSRRRRATTREHRVRERARRALEPCSTRVAGRSRTLSARGSGRSARGRQQQVLGHVHREANCSARRRRGRSSATRDQRHAGRKPAAPDGAAFAPSRRALPPARK